ncbi:unnamed protein product [Ambrosiozyma monospora]|uniref:Signal peptidase subunit 3 n=1 Tax=Ambrosiozyma monospora TaxID=43982 RepID=A0A9W6T408_AMBMO|nr:unnamed protein product [Ambrosiozyma monospora]
MFSITQRAQDVSSMITTSIGVLAVLISISSLIQLYLNDYNNLSGELSVRKAQNSVKFTRSFGGNARNGKENVRLSFDMETDLTPLFNWNTKQVFVYLVGEYDGLNVLKKAKVAKDESSKVVFWDKIIRDKADAVLDLKNTRSKYTVWDYYQKMGNRTANLKLEYNIQPHVGPLVWGSVDFNYPFEFPEPKNA